MDKRTRLWFDRLLDEVVEQLPQNLALLLEEVPVLVEDYPAPAVMRELGIEYRDELCGLHDGIPLTERTSFDPVGMPETITLYREGIVALAEDDAGEVDEPALQEQIRITLLHEIGHHFGMEEEDLKKYGYD